MNGLQGPTLDQKGPPKSPPMAFQTTSNDALWAPMGYGNKVPSQVPSLTSLTSPPASRLWDMHASDLEMDMQAQLDKQSEALRLQHQAFVAERESWQYEKERMYRRIASLEALLKSTANGHR